MDTSEYMPMFLAEAREHLEQLNLAIVKLEEDPKDRETIEEIFRIAHSFKGMAATMGFAKVAELTHNMEDVFELLRQRSGGLPSEAIDTVFACLDALSAATDSIETDGQEELDPAPLVKRLRSLVRPRTPEQQVDRIGGIDPPAHAAIQAARDAGARVLHIRVILTEDVMMPAVRAHMVLAAVGDHGEVLGSVPAPEGIEQFQGHEIESWVASDHEDAPIVTNLGSISEVAAVAVADVTRPDAPAAAAAAAPAPSAAPAEEPPSAPAPGPADPAPSSRRPPPRRRPARPGPREKRPRPTPTRPPARCASTPSASTRSCTRWASW